MGTESCAHGCGSPTLVVAGALCQGPEVPRLAGRGTHPPFPRAVGLLTYGAGALCRSDEKEQSHWTFVPTVKVVRLVGHARARGGDMPDRGKWSVPAFRPRSAGRRGRRGRRLGPGAVGPPMPPPGSCIGQSARARRAVWQALVETPRRRHLAFGTRACVLHRAGPWRGGGAARAVRGAVARLCPGPREPRQTAGGG